MAIMVVEIPVEAVKGVNEGKGGFESGVASEVLKFLVDVPKENIPFVDVTAETAADTDSDFPNIFVDF